MVGGLVETETGVTLLPPAAFEDVLVTGAFEAPLPAAAVVPFDDAVGDVGDVGGVVGDVGVVTFPAADPFSSCMLMTTMKSKEAAGRAKLFIFLKMIFLFFLYWMGGLNYLFLVFCLFVCLFSS